MKCRAMQNSWLKAMLAAGIVLLAGGLIWAYGVGAADGLPMRMAGFLSGLGGALAAIVAMTVTALVRGDHFYMMLGSAACCLVALVKIIAWYAYDKMM